MPMTPAEAQEDAAFWLNQDREHNVFFALGLANTPRKREAEELARAYDRALRSGDLRHAFAVLGRSQTFKRRLLADLSRPGAFVAGAQGYVWPAFVEHTMRELDVMLARRRAGGLSAAEETCFYDRMNADHAAFAAHLLDPSERALVDAATATSRKIGKIELATSACATTVLPSLIALSRDAAHDLDAFVSGPLPAARSLIHPVLGAHVLREGRRALAVLDRMAAA